jgi:hypothetical protein
MHGQPGFTLIRALSDADLREAIRERPRPRGRHAAAARDAARAWRERNDARRCPECHVHEQNGHLLTCERGARAGRTLRLVT